MTQTTPPTAREAVARARKIVSAIPFSEFPGKTYADREANARAVIAALNLPASAEVREAAEALLMQAEQLVRIRVIHNGSPMAENIKRLRAALDEVAK